MVQDYHYLNKHTVKNNYPLPFIVQLVDKLQGAKLFTKMDLRWEYNNVCIKENDEWKAAFTCFCGSFEPLVMYFGLCDLPTTFQVTIVTILFLGSALFLISSFHATSPFLGSLCYAYHHYLLILGPLTFTVHAL